MYNVISYNYSPSTDLFRVLVHNSDTNYFNHVDIGIIDHMGEICAEVNEVINSKDEENDIIGLALCYLDKMNVISKFEDDLTGELKWINKLKVQELSK